MSPWHFCSNSLTNVPLVDVLVLNSPSLFARYGRKTIFYLCAVLQLILGVAVAFVPEFYSLLVVRFFYGVFGSAGAYITGFVLSKCWGNHQGE